MKIVHVFFTTVFKIEATGQFTFQKYKFYQTEAMPHITFPPEQISTPKLN